MTPARTAADRASAAIRSQPVGHQQHEHSGDDRQGFDLGQGKRTGPDRADQMWRSDVAAQLARRSDIGGRRQVQMILDPQHAAFDLADQDAMANYEVWY